MTGRSASFSRGNATRFRVVFPRVCRGIAAALVCLGFVSTTWAQHLPGSVITNTARATFDTGAAPARTSDSNEVVLTVVPTRTGSSVEFLHYLPEVRASIAIPVTGTEYSASGEAAGPFYPLPGPVPLAGAPIDLTQPVPLETTTVYFQGDPVFLRVIDPDQNRDAATQDTILLTIANTALLDTELLRLYETGPDTGEFLGFIQTNGTEAPQAKNGVLSMRQDQFAVASYVDVLDATDRSAAQALFDPVGRIFDSRTGLPVGGVVVRLIDAQSGVPAVVHGRDGASDFPAELTTGEIVTDAGGATYDFGPGGYRFPHVADGQYRLELDAPPGYRAPSRLTDDVLQALPGAPFALITPGSRGETFFVTGRPLQIDIPLDQVDTDLFVTKTAGKTSVAAGDFLPYEIRVDNTTQDDASDLTVTDRLPFGFRFQSGSVLIDDQPAPDPRISADGRILHFARGELPAGAGFTIRYVLSVEPGAPVGDAVNRAAARWADVTSNEATALVTVRRDLFGETNTIIGQVRGFDCAADSSDGDPGGRSIAGVRIYLEDGAFAVTDNEGRYHIAGVAPGAHVVQMDLASLPPQYIPGDCSGDTLFSEHPWSRLVDLQGGTMWRSDFRLQRVPPAEGTVGLEMDTALQGTDIAGDVLVNAETVPVRNLRLTVVLPEETSYVAGSSRLGARPLPDPEGGDGNLVYRLGDLEAGQALTLHYGARVNPPLRRAELEVKAVLVCDTPTRRSARTDVVRTAISLVPETASEAQPEIVLRPRFASLSAELGPADRAQIDTLLAGLGDLEDLKIIAVKVVGHTDSQRIRPGSHPVFTDNQVLSVARAEAVGRHVSRSLHLNPTQLAMYGMGANEPVADNSSASGRALNRRVTLQILTEKVNHLLPEQTLRDHERVRLAVRGFRPGESWPVAAKSSVDTTTMPAFDEAWLTSAAPGPRILWPTAGHLPHIPALKLAVQHAVSDSVHLSLNGVETGRLNFSGRVIDATGNQAITTWTGLDLIEGDNRVSVSLIDAQGQLVQELERTVHYSGPPVFAELVPERSRLVADGKTIPVVALRLTDAMGYPARREVVGRFTVAAPHEAWRAKIDSERETITELQEKTPTYTIGADGIALLQLAPTTSSGEALLKLGLLEHEEEVRVWLQPASRDWILAGVIAGTVGYNTVAGNLESLAAADREDGFYSDGRLAFFAKGRLKGKWLLTMAYDSRTEEPTTQDGLFGVVDPDAYYTVYGDAVVQKHDAPSSDHLYIRLEREQFYALYGDFNSGLTVTELSHYSRTMTGLRSSRRGHEFGFDVFASQNRQNFRRDEIRGDGTSGLYRLSTGRIIPQSEQISLQVRDRYRNEIIISERHLVRSVDYTLDDLDGTLFFKEAIPSQDEIFNPLWIVASYETESASTDEITAGGRGSWRPEGGNVEVGLTGIREGTQGGDADVLAGLDTQWDMTRSLRLKGEYAGSDTRRGGRSEAWFGELSNRAGPVLGRLYYRDRKAGFGLGQQNRGEAGTRKFGADLRWQQHASWRADGTLFGQRNLVSGDERHFGELKISHDSRRFTAGLGLRAANDEKADGTLLQSRQATADASLRFLANKGRVRIGREQALTGQDDIADFPNRTALGLEYEVVRNQKLFLAQELVDGGGPATHRTRLGVESVPWTGARLTSSAERRSRENDRRVFANAGLKQSLRLNETWHLDASLDHGLSGRAASDSLGSGTTAAEDFTAGSLGATYRAGLWLVDQRLEFRTSNSAEKWGLAGGVHVEPRRSLGLLASVRLVRTDYRLAGHHNLADVGLGLAWRPQDNPWTILQRLSYRTEDKSGGPFALSHWRVVNNLNVLRMLNARDQISGQVGLRYNRDTIAGQRYAGFSDQLGLEWRHFIGSRWDLGVRGSTRHSWHSGNTDYSGGVSGGYKVLEDIWLSLGYNFAGYRDRDFSASDYTAQGPYLRFRVRLNQESTHEMLR